MPVRAVAFDIDGTLYPNVVMYLKSTRFALAHLRLMRAYARVREEIRTIRPIDDLQRLEAQLLAERLGIGEDEARRQIHTHIYGEWETVLDRVKPYPGVRECVQSLRDAGFPVAVTSDFPVERKLERLGLDDLFDCRLWTEESGYLKPHPEPFLALAACMGFEPSEILYVGNSYEYDVVGAKRVGMSAAHLSRRERPGTIADFTFSRYDDLCRWIMSRVTPE